jgi:hypothetical protein
MMTNPEMVKEKVHEDEVREIDSQVGIIRTVDGREVPMSIADIVVSSSCVFDGSEKDVVFPGRSPGFGAEYESIQEEWQLHPVEHVSANREQQDIQPIVDHVMKDKIDDNHRIIWVGDSGQPPHPAIEMPKKPQINFNPPV